MAGLLTAAMIAPASAAGVNEILKGTPELDGALDDIYTQSAVYTIIEGVVKTIHSDLSYSTKSKGAVASAHNKTSKIKKHTNPRVE